MIIVDGDKGVLTLIKRALKREGWEAATAGCEEAVIEWLSQNSADLMLLDLKLQDTDGKALVEHLESSGKTVPFMAITGQGDERVAVDMMKRGALDYLVKDTQFLEFLPTFVRRALAHIEKEKRLLTIERAQGLQHEAAVVLAQAATLSEAITRTLEVICRSLDLSFGELWNVGAREERSCDRAGSGARMRGSFPIGLNSPPSCVSSRECALQAACGNRASLNRGRPQRR